MRPRRIVPAIVSSFAAVLPAVAEPLPADTIPAYVAAAVADPSRPDADRRRDVDRRPAQVIAFAEVKPGDKVADFNPERDTSPGSFAKWSARKAACMRSLWRVPRGRPARLRRNRKPSRRNLPVSPVPTSPTAPAAAPAPGAGTAFRQRRSGMGLRILVLESRRRELCRTGAARSDLDVGELSRLAQ